MHGSKSSVTNQDRTTSPPENSRGDLDGLKQGEPRESKYFSPPKVWVNPFAFSNIKSSLPNENPRVRDKDWFNPFDRKYFSEAFSKKQPRNPKANRNPFASCSTKNYFKDDNPFVLPNPFVVGSNPFAPKNRIQRAKENNILDVDMSEPVNRCLFDLL